MSRSLWQTIPPMLFACAVALAPGFSASQQLRMGRQVDHPSNGMGRDGVPGDDIGRAVAIAGDIAVVGAPSDRVGERALGSAYVFRRNGNTWQLAQKLLPAEEQFDRFGWSVAISGGTIVVGAIEHDQVDFADEGAAFVFVEEAGVWREQQKLVAEDASPDDLFGNSVAIDGDTLLVGALYDDEDSFSGRGSAYVFERSGQQWSQRAKLAPAISSAGMGFGSSVAVSGGTALVGAYLHTNAQGGEGSATFYTRQGANWVLQQTVIAPNGELNDRFGASVALVGDRSVVGAYGDSNNAQELNEGAAYVFARVANVWSLQQRLAASDAARYDGFGYSVSLRGQSLVIGAPSIFGSAPGSAYVFEYNGAAWTQQAKLQRQGNRDEESFGFSVAIEDGWVLAGVPRQVGNRVGREGAAHAFQRFGNAWIQATALDGGLGTQHSWFGTSIALTADTAVVGAPFNPEFELRNERCATVFARDGLDWTPIQRLTPPPSAQDSRYGASVAIAGDLLVVGAPFELSQQGAAYVYARIAGTWSLQTRLISPDGTGRFGEAVAIAGNQVLVGAGGNRFISPPQPGSVFVFERMGGSFPIVQELELAITGTNFGAVLAVQGDTAAIAAAGSAEVHVFVRNGTVWQAQQRLQPEGSTPFMGYGTSLAVYGDTVVIGDPQAVLPDTFARGAGYVFVRSGTAWTLQTTIENENLNPSEFGRSAAMHGDRLVLGSVDNLFSSNALGQFNIFRRDAGVWRPSGTIRADQYQDGFASALAMDESSIVAGAPKSEQPGPYANAETGAVHVFSSDVGDFIFVDGFE